MIGTRISSGSPFEEMAGYSRAVVDGDIVYVSGTTGYDVKAGGFPATVEEQATLAFATISAALAQAGTSLENMLRIRVYVASRDEFERIKPIIKTHCDAARPANTTILCELATEEMRVEFEVTARIGD
jgi:enamine deaminase RidA (YjgF/YER057c/UK114 family)